jgi:hypothetical protein
MAGRSCHTNQPPTMVNRWWRGAGARVVLGLAIVVTRCDYFGAIFEGRGAGPTRVHIHVPCPYVSP